MNTMCRNLSLPIRTIRDPREDFTLSDLKFNKSRPEIIMERILLMWKLSEKFKHEDYNITEIMKVLSSETMMAIVFK